jgi:uncharacterized protein (DUF2062 family)
VARQFKSEQPPTPERARHRNSSTLDGPKQRSGQSQMRRGLPAVLVRHFRAQLELLKQEHASSGRLGVAVGVGVLLGCSPFLGFQLLLALALGKLLRLNRLAVLFGLQISVPPLTPFILFATAQAGALLRRGQWLPLHVAAFRGEPASKVLAGLFLDMLVGTALVGGALAVFLGGMSALGFWWLRATKSLSRQFTPEQWTELWTRLHRLPIFFRRYAAWKLRLDPVFLLVLAELPPTGELVDLGTGMGLLPVLLGLSRPSLRIRGVEWDTRKAEVARRLVMGLPEVTIDEGDARAYPLGTPQAITLLDILHYSPPAEAQAWLSSCAGALAPGGVLLIRELEPSTWAIAPWLERVAVQVTWNRGRGVYARPSSALVQELTDLGLTVVCRPAGSGLFRANTLTIARRPGSSHGN